MKNCTKSRIIDGFCRKIYFFFSNSLASFKRLFFLPDCVNYVLQFVDGEILPELVPKLIDLIKSSIGLGTKGTAASVIISLTHQCPQELQVFTGKILAAFVAGLSDRNPAVRKTYASAIGHLMKTAKDSSVDKLFAKLRNWYMDKDDESSKWAVAFTFQAVTRHNPDRMKAHAAQAMPLAYLAMHEPKSESNGEILDVWDEVWTDGTPGTESGIRLYLKEIVALLTVTLESPQWKIKAQTASAMATIGSKLKSDLPAKEQGQLLVQLLEGLSGRTWSGKENLLVAVQELVCSHPDNVSALFANADNSLTEEILMKCLLRECGKERLEYKIKALESTSKILRALDLDYFQPLYDMLQAFISKKEASTDDKDSEQEQETISLDLQLAVVKCLGEAWPEAPDTQQSSVVELCNVLETMMQNTTRKLQLAITTTTGQVMASYNLNKKTDHQVFSKVSSILAFALSMPKNSQLRAEALKVLDQTLDVLDKLSMPDIIEMFQEQMTKSIDDVVKDLATDASLKDKARRVKQRMVLLHQNEEQMECD